MAERIKGLQIDLSMKDMGVQRSLAEIKRSFKGLNADLKLSNNNFKYSEKSLNSYKLRTRELSQAVKESKANVAALKAKYQEVSRESGVNSKKAAQLRQEYSRQADNLNYLQNELDQTRGKYREMIAVSKSSIGRLGQTFSEIGPRIKSVGDSMKSVGRNMSLHVTAPITAGFGAAMKKSVDFDDTMRKVKATSGATGNEFNQLRTKALQMGRDTKFTASESAEAMNYMALAGWDTKDMLKGVGGVMNLAAASGEDLASVSDIVTDNLTAFGMKAKDSTHFADVLAQTSSKANTDVRGLGEAFKYAAPVAGALGYTVEDTSIAIGLMSNAGIKGEKAGTALRTMFTNLAKPTKAMKEEMDKLGISITDSNGEMLPMRDVMDQLRNKMGGLTKDQQAAAASTIFGKEAMSGALAVINASDEDYKKLTKSIDGSNGASKRMANEMEGGIGGAMRKMKSAIESLAISLGDALAPMLYKIAKWITSLANKFTNLPKGIQKTIAIVGLLAAAIGPLLMIFGVMASTIGTAITALGSLMTSMRTLSFLSKTSAAATGIWNGVTATARGIANGYRYAVAALTTSQTIQAVKSKIAAAAIGIWNGVTATAHSIANGYRYAIAALTTSQTIQAIKTKIAIAATKAWAVVTRTAALATKGLGLAIRFMTGPIGIVITAIGLLAAGITHLWKTNATFRNVVMSVWQSVQDKVMSVVVSITSTIKRNIPLIKVIFSNTFNGARNIVKGSLDIILGIAKVFSGLFTGNFRKMWSGVKQIFSGFIKVIKGIFQVSFVNQIVKLARIMGAKIKATFSNLAKVSRAIFSALGAWMSKKWTSIKNNTVGKAKLLWSGVKKWWSNLGKNTRATMNSIGSFMSKKWQSIKDGTVRKAKSTWSGVKKWWSKLNKDTRATMNSVGSFMSKKWRGIKNSTVNLVTGMKNKVTGVMDKMGNVIKSVTGKIKGFFKGMISGVGKGLNGLIKGVNWVGKKLGMDALPKVKLHTGTESTHTQNIVTNGKVNRDTFATVGDKGRGNGPGGFRHEMIRYPNGKTTLTPNRDTTTFLPKGSSVINGKQTHSILNNLPKFSKGTSKKKRNLVDFGNYIKGKFGEKASQAAHGIKQGTQKALEKSANAIGKGKSWLEDKIGDVMEWVGKPGKLFEKIADAFGINIESFGIPKKASLPFDMMKGMFGKLKTAAIDMIKNWMEEAEGGDGDAAWLFKHPIWQKFGSYTGGLNFNGGRHYGVDFGMPIGTNVYAVKGGKADKVWTDYGGGKSVQIKTGQGEWNWYMHLSKQIAKQGQRIKPGQLIGKSGDTGNFVRGAHLHFQLMKGSHAGNDTAKDPLKWLKSLKGGGKVGGSGSANARKAIKKAQAILGGRYKSSYITEQMMRVAKRESNFQAGAVNNWDSNAKAGTPSKGMFQMIEPSFKAYAKAGHGNILNPTDQAISAMRYIVGKWVPIMGSWRSAFKRAGDYAYKTGGMVTNKGLYNLAEDGYPEFVIPTDPARQSDAMKLLAIAAEQIGGDTAGNKRPKQLRSPNNLGGSDDQEVVNMLARQLEATQQQVDLLTQLVASSRRIEEQPKGFNEREVSKAQGKRARMMAYNMGGAF